jgi:hypothetical protein
MRWRAALVSSNLMQIDRAGWLRTRAPRISCVAVALVAALLISACDASASPPPIQPTAAPTPTPTPNPHLADPAELNAVYSYLGRHGLKIIPNTASTGEAGVRGSLTATYDGWPLLITDYTSAVTLAKDGFVAGAKAGPGDAPFAIVGLNILVEYGPPESAKVPAAPERRFVLSAQRLVDLLDRLLGPLSQRSVVSLKLPPAPSPSVAPSPSAKSSPSAKPRSPAPKPRSPKPSPSR